MTNIVILTGAGISSESGIPTFRDSNGLWENHNVMDVASIKGFENNPNLVYKFYNDRRADLKTREPNSAHLALKELEDYWKNIGDFTLITQNIDDLHDRVGSTVIHMHGELNSVLCSKCQHSQPHFDDIDSTVVCSNCGTMGTCRPDVVWFGEMPYYLTNIQEALDRCDIMVSIGTSGQVYPAAGFIDEVKGRARIIEVNPCPSRLSTIKYKDVATIGVRELVDDLKSGLYRKS